MSSPYLEYAILIAKGNNDKTSKWFLHFLLMLAYIPCARILPAWKSRQAMTAIGLEEVCPLPERNVSEKQSDRLINIWGKNIIFQHHCQLIILDVKDKDCLSQEGEA